MQWERNAGRWGIYTGTYNDYIEQMKTNTNQTTYNPAYSTNPDPTTQVRAYIGGIWEESTTVSVVYDLTTNSLLAFSLDFLAGTTLYQTANEILLADTNRAINKAIIMPALIKFADIYKASEMVFFVLGGCQKEERIYVIAEGGGLQFRIVGLPLFGWLGVGIRVQE